MKRFGRLPVLAFACLCLTAVLLPAAAPAAVHVRALSGPAYLWTLKVEGGTAPGWQLVKSVHGKGVVLLKVDVKAPLALEVRVSGNVASVSTATLCRGTVIGRMFSRAGVYTLPVSKGAPDCFVSLEATAISGGVTLQLLAKHRSPSAPAPTPTPTPKPTAHSFDGEWAATFTGTLNGGSSYYPATPCCAGPIVMVVNYGFIDPSNSGASAGYGLGTVGNIASNGDATMIIAALKASNLSYSSALGASPGCRFQAHFTTSGTADGTVSCGASPPGLPASFTGTFHAVRTSTTP